MSQIDGWFLRYIIAAMLDMMNSQKVYSYLYSNYNFIQQGEIVFFPYNSGNWLHTTNRGFVSILIDICLCSNRLCHTSL